MHARRDKKLETAPCCHGIHAPRHVGLLRVQEWCGEVAGRMAWDSAYAWIDPLQLTNKPLLELAGIAVKQLMQTRNIGKLLVRALEPVGLKVITRPPLQSPSSSGGGARLVPLERISISEVGPASLAALADTSCSSARRPPGTCLPRTTEGRSWSSRCELRWRATR